MNRSDAPVKIELYKLGVEQSKLFLKTNGLQAARYQITSPLILRRQEQTGLCERMDGKTTIHVNVPVTAFPRKIPVCCMRSYPGSKIDRTATGVVCHETGHHVEFVLAARRKFPFVEWRKIVQGSRKQVSGYEPNVHEAFAETMRLFILNPNLLFFGMPARYNFIEQELGLKPIVTKFWPEILPVPHHAAMYSWIEKRA